MRHAGQYTFTKIADSGGPIQAFYTPTINASGDVAYLVAFKDGAQGVFATKDGVPVPILTSHDSFQGIPVVPGFLPNESIASINDSGTVGFWATTTDGIQHILTEVPGSLPIEYAKTSPGPGGFAFLVNPWLGNSGDIAFGATARDMSGNEIKALYNEGNPQATFPLGQLS